MSDNMIIHDILDPVKTKMLDSIRNQIELHTNKIRVVNGKSGAYLHSNWNEWSYEKRDMFMSCFDSDVMKKSVIGWYLNIPANVGNLPYNDSWVDAEMAGTVYAYALNDDAHILLDDVKYTLKRGQGIKFSLKIPHEIISSNIDHNWACLMCFE